MRVSVSLVHVLTSPLHLEPFSFSSEPPHFKVNLSLFPNYTDFVWLPRRGSFLSLCVMRERRGHYSHQYRWTEGCWYEIRNGKTRGSSQKKCSCATGRWIGLYLSTLPIIGLNTNHAPSIHIAWYDNNSRKPIHTPPCAPQGL